MRTIAIITALLLSATLLVAQANQQHISIASTAQQSEAKLLLDILREYDAPNGQWTWRIVPTNQWTATLDHLTKLAGRTINSKDAVTIEPARLTYLNEANFTANKVKWLRFVVAHEMAHTICDVDSIGDNDILVDHFANRMMAGQKGKPNICKR